VTRRRSTARFERTVTLTADDTLTVAQQKITDAGAGVTSAIINDGSGLAPYRLSLTSRNPGRNGRAVIDSGTLTALQTSNLVEAQDAAVFVGNAGSAEPLLVTSGSNQVTGVIKGVTIDLHGVSDRPVSLSVTRTADTVVEDVKKFTDNFNELVDKIKEYTKFDTTTNERGCCSATPRCRRSSRTSTPSSARPSPARQGAGGGGRGAQARRRGEAGVRRDEVPRGLRERPEAVETLFARLPASLSSETPLAQLNNGKGVRPSPVGADFEFTVKDGTKVSVALGPDATTLGEVLGKINAAGAGKLTASIGANGISLSVKDNTTTGTETFRVQALNGSTALGDLGIPAAALDGLLNGRTILPPSPTQRLSAGSGLGHVLENSLSRLIDPVDGAISKENKQLDSKNFQFQSRIEALDKLIASKRGRLERQFAQMESVLANLQGQQQALGSLQTLAAR
jgi:flagellar capping protein FliD